MDIRRASRFIVVSLILAGTFLHGEDKPVAPAAAPVPEQIPSAKRVFISNAGMDTLSANTFHELGDPDRPYNLFYAAMKAWGRYELVGNPADADLVFEIRFAAPIGGAGFPNSYGPGFTLTILDARSHFTLWNLVQPVEGAIRKGTFVRNLNRGMTDLMADVKRLAGQPQRADAR